MRLARSLWCDVLAFAFIATAYAGIFEKGVCGIGVKQPKPVPQSV